MTSGPVPAEGGTPVVRFTHGAAGATDAEIAAVLTVLLARGQGSAPADPPALSQWRNRSRNIRPAIGRGPGAWRASGLPR